MPAYIHTYIHSFIARMLNFGSGNSLLYNWSRTKSFVQTLSAQIVWNTWVSVVKSYQIYYMFSNIINRFCNLYVIETGAI